MKEKVLCDNCKKEIEKPSYLLIIFGYIWMIILLSMVCMGIILVTKTAEIFSIGERMIILFLSFLTIFGFYIIPLHIEDLKKLYDSPDLKIFKNMGKWYFLPYALTAIYFGLILGSSGEYNFSLIAKLGNWIFFVLIGLPLIVDTIKKLGYKLKRKKK